jgi:hypothetical protein
MKQVLASLTTLIRHLLIAGHDTVADSAFGLALQRSGDVAAEGEETVGYAAVLEGGVSLILIWVRGGGYVRRM